MVHNLVDLLASVADGNEADVNRAVASAADALEGWVAIGGHGRARYLYAMARHIQKNARLFSVLESLDNGKPIRESRDVDIPLVARHFYHHAGWAQVMQQELPGFRPIGVVGQIIPWNFPLLLAATLLVIPLGFWATAGAVAGQGRVPGQSRGPDAAHHLAGRPTTREATASAAARTLARTLSRLFRACQSWRPLP